MIKKNTILLGVVLGLLFPALSYVILNEVNLLLIAHYFGRPPGLSQRFIAILAIASNLAPIFIANRSASAKTMRGVMSATLILTAIVVVYFWDEFM